MTPAQIGGMAGAAFGLVGFAALRFVADRIDTEHAASGRDKPAHTNIIRLIAVAEIVVLTVVGYFVGPLVLGPN